MKTIRSPNLAPGDQGIMVMVTHARGYARGGLVKAASAVRGAGRFGDTMLVHLNRQEFHQLRRAWGEPHFNPDTELPEFFKVPRYDIGGLIGDVTGGDWGSVIGDVAPYVVGALSSKASADQANQNPAPPSDPNMTTHLGHYVDNKTQIPLPSQTLQSYYKYGQGPETTFYKNNGLANVTGTPGAQLPPRQQYSPSTAGAIGSGVLGSLLQSVLRNPKALSSLFSKNGTPGSGNLGADGQSVIQNLTNNPDWSSLAAGALASTDGAGALPALGASPALHGAITVADLTPEEEAALQAGGTGGAGVATGTGAGVAAGTGAAEGAAGGADAAAAAGSGDLLPGSIAGADMADTAAYTPAALEATSGGEGAAAGAGSVLGGIAAGGGAFGAFNVLANYLMNNTAMSPADYHRLWNDQSAALRNQIATETDPTKKAQLESNLADTQATLTMLKDNLSGAGGRANPSFLPQRQLARGGAVRRYDIGGQVMPGGALNAQPQFGVPATNMQGPPPQFGTPVMPGPPPVQIGIPNNLQRAPQLMPQNNMGAPPIPGAPIPRQPMPMGMPPPGALANTQRQPMPSNMPPPGMSNLRPGMIQGGPSPFAANRSQIGMPAMPPRNFPPPTQPMPRPQLGGPLNQSMMARPPSMLSAPPVNGRPMATGGSIDGPGTGTSDDIPARVSTGEYIVPAHVVSALGDGSTSAGAARLDQMQRNVRLSVGKQMAAGKHPKPAKPPTAYMSAKGVK